MAKDSAARNFIRSVQFADVLRNGILVFSNDEVPSRAEDEISSEHERMGNVDEEPHHTRSTTENQSLIKDAAYQDNGNGWSIIVKSEKSINSATKKKLIEVAELLDGIEPTKDD